VALNLLSFWMVEGFRVWFYNAVPNVNVLELAFDPSGTVVQPGAAPRAGFLYAILLVLIAILALLPSSRRVPATVSHGMWGTQLPS